MDVLRILGKTFNFNMTVRRAGEWGVPINLAKNAWTGVIGSVYNGTADIGIAHVTLTYLRLRVMDHCPVFINLPHVLSAKPKRISTLYNLVKPFDKIIWFLLPALLSLVIVVFIKVNQAG